MSKQSKKMPVNHLVMVSFPVPKLARDFFISSINYYIKTAIKHFDEGKRIDQIQFNFIDNTPVPVTPVEPVEIAEAIEVTEGGIEK